MGEGAREGKREGGGRSRAGQGRDGQGRAKPSRGRLRVVQRRTYKRVAAAMEPQRPGQKREAAPRAEVSCAVRRASDALGSEAPRGGSGERGERVVGWIFCSRLAAGKSASEHVLTFSQLFPPGFRAPHGYGTWPCQGETHSPMAV